MSGYTGTIAKYMEFIWVVPGEAEKNARLKVTKVVGNSPSALIYAIDMGGDPKREMSNFEETFRLYCVRVRPLMLAEPADFLLYIPNNL